MVIFALPYFCTVKKAPILFICLLCSVLSWAQTDTKPKYPHFRPTFDLDGKFTWVSNQSAKLFGIRVGAEIDRVNRFGMGYYALKDPVYTTSLSEISPQINRAVLNMSYSSIYYERVIHYSKKYEWAANIQAGIGRIEGNYVYLNGTSGNYASPFQMTELSTTFYRHLTYFISIGGGIGYRQTFNTPQELRPIYNAPIVILKVRFQPIKMVRGLWNKEIRHRY